MADPAEHETEDRPRHYRGTPAAAAGNYAIVVSRYNDKITGNLLAGAESALREAGVPAAAIEVAWVPGAFELPLVAHRMAGSGRFLAVICLGAVIRGDTSHDRHINRAVSLGLTEAALASGVPVLFGVLTCDTLEQAIHRSGGNMGNKGTESALAALEMVQLMEQLP